MMETAAPELHDAILLCVGVAAVYLVVTVLQLLQLKRHGPVTLVAREPSVGSQLPLDMDASSPSALPLSHQLKRTSVEAGLKRLDLEVVRLHMELQAMRDEVKRLRGAPNVAPLYHEAMNLARRGLGAVGIASRCGISMGEAELVAALARNPKDGLAQSPAVNECHEQQYDRYRAAA